MKICVKSRWSAEEHELVKNSYASKTAKEIAKSLGRSERSVSCYINRMLGAPKKRQVVLVAPSKAVVAYTAGILDGEGSIQINRSRGPTGLFFGMGVQIASSSVGFLEKLRADWSDIGVATYWQPKGSTRFRKAGNWRIYGENTSWFLRLLLPHLRIKKEQCEIALEFRKYVSSGRNSLTLSMTAARAELAVRMREANSRLGKGVLKFDRDDFLREVR
jgi:DNA-binding CsgD family transcriptional regulator